ncbi:MAG: hypothetical protein HYX26_01580 [Acidobacteriales bacterium]|nr:hypothetical protein [Terriglobales bacterium]
MTKTLVRILQPSTFLVFFTLFTQPAAAWQALSSECTENTGVDTAQPKGITPEEIVRKVSAKESEFSKARDQYTYRRDVKVQTLDGSTITGEFREVADITYRDDGRRVENVVFAPQSTLTRISMTAEDVDDIKNRYPFVLTASDLPLYQALYVGQQKLDEIDTYAFDLAPKNMEQNKRYFQGRIWVDAQDLQVVKTCGRPAYLPSKKTKEQQFPSFASYREQVDGQYWFPTYVRADEVLHFPVGRQDKHGNASLFDDVHIRIIVKYQDYKKFQSKSRVIFSGEVAPETPPKPEEPKK